jgi:CelD/BcsL family acetyltransferase involved in cellulose biosynthesis
MAEITEIRSIEQLASLRLVWHSLWQQTPKATFFQSLDWLEAYWRHHGHEQELRVLVVSSAGQTIGIVPLVVVTESTRVGSVRFLTYPLQDWGSFYGPVGPNPTATLTAAMRHLRNTPRDWDVLDLRWVDCDRTDRGRTKRAMAMVGFRPQEQPWMHGAEVELPESWDEYWNARPRRWRENVRRCRRRLDDLGEVTYVRYRPEGITHGDADARWDLFEACLEVAERSWQADSSNGNTLSSPEVREFLRDAHEAAGRAGTLDMNVLFVDGRPVAFAYNYHCQGRVFGLRKGYDPEYRSGSPGVVLDHLMLKDGCVLGDTHYELGVGSIEAKRHWITGQVTSYRMTHFARTAPKAQVLRLKRWYQDRFTDPAALVATRSA